MLLYETVKYVAIPDARLATLKFGLTVLIVGYIGIVQLGFQNAYLKEYNIKGVARFSLKQPTMNNCNPIQDAENCSNAFAALDELPYCAQSRHFQHPTPQQQTAFLNATNILKSTRHLQHSKDHNKAPPKNVSIYSGPVYPCQIYEAVNAQVLRETSAVLWTRATTYEQTLVCDESTQMTCPKTYENVNGRAWNPSPLWTTSEYEGASKVLQDPADVTPNPHLPQNQEVTELSNGPFFIAQSEAFTLLLEHAVTSIPLCHNQLQVSRHLNSNNNHNQPNKNGAASKYACSSQSENYRGRLRSDSAALCVAEWAKQNAFDDPRSNTLQHAAPCYIGPNQTSTSTSSAAPQDYFSLHVLLQAAGVNMDDCVVWSEEGENVESADERVCLETIRSSGGTLLLEVSWNDAVPWKGLVDPYYTYRTQWIGGSYKESQAFYYKPYRKARILFRGHGIKVAVVLGGTFHNFEILPCLITLTAALGLLAAARVIVDNLMLYVLPDKERYQLAKYETVQTTSTPSPYPQDPARQVMSPRNRQRINFINSADSVASSASHPPTRGQQLSLLRSFVPEETNSLTDPLLQPRHLEEQ